jgi:chaperonin GroES
VTLSNFTGGTAKMASNITPLQDRILIQRPKEKETIKGGIIIPDSAREKPYEGDVIAVGPGRFDSKGQRIPMDVKIGDRVLFGKYSGNEISVDGEEFFIIEEKDVLVKIGHAAKAAGGKK